MTGWQVTLPAYATLAASAVARSIPRWVRVSRQWFADAAADRRVEAARQVEWDAAYAVELAAAREENAAAQPRREARDAANAARARRIRPVGTPVDLLNHRGP